MRRELEAAHAENFNITELLYFLLKARMVICDYTSGITRSVGAMLLDGSKIVKNLNMFAEMVRFDQASLVRPPNPPLHTPLTTTNPTPPSPPRLHPRTNHPPELNRFLDTLTGVHQ